MFVLANIANTETCVVVQCEHCDYRTGNVVTMPTPEHRCPRCGKEFGPIQNPNEEEGG